MVRAPNPLYDACRRRELVPSAAQLTTQFQSTDGLTFSSAGGFASVVNLGAGHATSGTNGITGSRPDGTLTYDARARKSDEAARQRRRRRGRPQQDGPFAKLRDLRLAR